jgi:hypothetical protein
VKKLIIVLTFAILVIALRATVQAATTTKNVSGTIKGTFAFPAASGACLGTGYAAECPSGSCKNVTPVGTPTGTGTIGKGTVTGMCLTVDFGLPVNTPPDGKSTCAPYFGTLTYHTTDKTTKSPVSTTANLTGPYCHH